MVLSMNSRPLPGYHAREKTQFQMHEQTDGGVQFQTLMGLVAMQVDCREQNRGLQDHQGDDRHPQKTHSHYKCRISDSLRASRRKAGPADSALRDRSSHDTREKALLWRSFGGRCNAFRNVPEARLYRAG